MKRISGLADYGLWISGLGVWWLESISGDDFPAVYDW